MVNSLGLIKSWLGSLHSHPPFSSAFNHPRSYLWNLAGKQSIFSSTDLGFLKITVKMRINMLNKMDPPPLKNERERERKKKNPKKRAKFFILPINVPFSSTFAVFGSQNIFLKKITKLPSQLKRSRASRLNASKNKSNVCQIKLYKKI